MSRAKGRVGAQIIEALKEAVSDAKGKRTGMRKRVVKIPVDGDVKAIRRRLRMSRR